MPKQQPKGLLQYIMEICEKSGDIVEIDTDYFQNMINMGDTEMRQLIRLVILSRKDYINDTDQWKTEDKLLGKLGSTLYFFMSGIMYCSERGELIIAKPSHMPTDEEKVQLISRADSERSTMLEVLWEILKSQPTA